MSANLRRAPALAALALAGAAAIALAGAGGAAASAQGCTYTNFPHEYVCTTIHGEKLHVESVDVIRGKLDGGTIRDYSATVTVRQPDASEYRWESGVTHEKSYNRAYVSFDINRSFDDGSKLCGSFYESGTLQDTACLTIHD